MNVKPLFKLMVEKKASDLFFAPFAPAKIKIDGKIMPVNKLEMTPKMVRQAAKELMDEDQLDSFTRDLEIDFAISEPGLGRFRVNLFLQRSTIGIAIRVIAIGTLSFEELHLPRVIEKLALETRGLILCTGTTGSER